MFGVLLLGRESVCNKNRGGLIIVIPQALLLCKGYYAMLLLPLACHL